MSVQEKALGAIEAQQAKEPPRSAVWMVGEQLKDICRREPKSAEILAQDLRLDALSLAQAEKQIHDFADKHRTGSFACVTAAEADRILRAFYGLPAPEEAAPPPPGVPVDLADFL